MPWKDVEDLIAPRPQKVLKSLNPRFPKSKGLVVQFAARNDQKMIQHFENQKSLGLLNGIKKALKYFKLRPLDINFDRTNRCQTKLGDHIIALPHA